MSATAPQLFKRGNVFWCRFSCAGEQHRFTTGECEETTAQRKAHEIWLRITGHNQASDVRLNPLHDAPSLVFQRHVKDLENLQRNQATIYNYELYATKYREFFGDRPLSLLARKDIEGWRDWLSQLKRQDRGHSEQTVSPKYVREHIAWLSAVFNHFDLANPCKKVERPRISHSAERERLKFFSTAQMRKLLEEVKKSEFENAFTFLAFTGCRDGELRGIRNSDLDIDLKRQMAWVTGKGSFRRQLTLRGPAEPAWQALLKEVGRRGVAKGEFVFHQYERWTDKRLRALCTGCGYAPVGPHTLRHTFASHALMSWGWDLGLLAKWLGHKTVDTTYRIYGHLLPQEPPHISY